MEKSNAKRVEELLAFSLGMINGQDGRMLIEKYREAPNTRAKLLLLNFKLN